ncbi:hypothetical protein [Microbispora bryophytorum]|uniref:hypothetical protein n=1 Tax=Microbispora bryophytorum TaxID=1460882 RepID=UPI0033FFD241
MIPRVAGRLGRQNWRGHEKSALLRGKADRKLEGLESLPALLSPDEREQLSAPLARLPHSMAALRG